jgi:hypothetical protein
MTANEEKARKAADAYSKKAKSPAKQIVDVMIGGLGVIVIMWAINNM